MKKGETYDITAQRKQGKEQHEVKKEELLKKVKKHRKVSICPTPENGTNEQDYKRLYKEMKKEKEKIEKQRNDLQREKNRWKKKADMQEKKINRHHQERFEDRKILTEQGGIIKELNWKQEELKKEQMVAEQEKHQLLTEKEMMAHHLTALKKKLHHVQTIQTSSQRLSDRYRIQNEQLEKKLEQQEKVIKNQHKMILQLQTRVNRLSTADVQTFMTYFIEHMDMDTIQEYHQVPELNKRYNRIRSGMKLRLASSKLQEKQEYPTRFGYLEEKESGWIFVDTDNHNYTVIRQPNYPLKKGMTISASVNEEEKTASISWVYRNQQTFEEDRKKEKQVKEKKKESANIIHPWELTKPVSVLLVTSKAGGQYRDRLRKHGVGAIWMDPYEKNIKHIEETASSYDIVLLFEDAMPHSARTLIDVYGEGKIQTIYQHNEELVVARIRYVLMKNDWLKMDN